MDCAEHVEGEAVNAFEEEGQRGTVHFPGEAGGGGVPLGIGHPALSPAEVRDFARQEHDQQAALAEAFEGGAEALSILVGVCLDRSTRAGRAGRLKGADEDDARVKSGRGGEQGVGDDAVIGADSFQESDENEASSRPKGWLATIRQGPVFGMRSTSLGSTL
jgi:hypothetical protein